MGNIKKIFIKELSPIWLLAASIILVCLLSGLGFIHLVIKCIYESFQKKFWKGSVHFIIYIGYILYQIWNVIKFIFLELAIALDLFGNVTAGEAIEDLITYEEKTLFGRGDVTISTATGEVEHKGKLNKLGKGFSITLSKILDKDHAINSYKRWLHNQKFEL